MPSELPKDMVEAVARAMCSGAGMDPDAFWAKGVRKWQLETASAQAAIRTLAPMFLDMAAGVAKTAWVSADYNVVGVADADMAMALCEHAEREVLSLKEQFQ